MSDRLRGSITDTITMESYPFQFEPVIDDQIETNYADQKILGRRLSNKQWIGGGKGDLSIALILVGAGYTETTSSDDELWEESFKQRLAAVNQEKPYIWSPPVMNGTTLVERGKYIPNPGYNPAKIVDASGNVVDNPNYVNPVQTTKQLAASQQQRKLKSNAKVQDQLNTLAKMIEPKDDTGAPHPIYVNMASRFTGRKFLAQSMKVTEVITNYSTLEPTEAHVELTVVEIPCVTKKV